MSSTDRDQEVIDRANDLIDNGADLRTALITAQRDVPAADEPSEE